MSDLLFTLFGDATLLSEEDVAAFAAAHQLGDEPSHEVSEFLSAERQVTQWIGGKFVCWEEFWLSETQHKAIRLIAPERRWLSRLEAAHLICASRSQRQLEVLVGFDSKGSAVA